MMLVPEFHFPGLLQSGYSSEYGGRKCRHISVIPVVEPLKEKRKSSNNHSSQILM